jgi:hypothetical protein
VPGPYWPARRSASLGGVDNLICTECGVTYYSAAAPSMVARGELCDCGGPLVERPPDGVVPIERYGVNLTVITSPSRIA